MAHPLRTNHKGPRSVNCTGAYRPKELPFMASSEPNPNPNNDNDELVRRLFDPLAVHVAGMVVPVHATTAADAALAERWLPIVHQILHDVYEAHVGHPADRWEQVVELFERNPHLVRQSDERGHGF
jgi:hypothetical protein